MNTQMKLKRRLSYVLISSFAVSPLLAKNQTVDSHIGKLELRVSSSAKKKSDKNGGIGLFLERDYRVLVSLLFPPNRGFGGSAPIFDRLPFSRTFKND